MNIDIYKSLFDKFNSTLIYENIKDDNGKIIEGNACEIDKIYYHLYTIKPSLDNISEDIKILIAEFDTFSQFTDKMKFICDQKEILNELSFSILLDSIPIIFKNYYSTLGSDFCKSVSYRKCLLETEYDKRINNQDININSIIYSNFQVGGKYLMSDIKEKLREIYKSINYKSSPKASDLEKYFKLKTYKITNKETGKRDPGFEIISKK